MTPSYTIENVWIQLTYPNEIVENFQLKKPNGFRFGLRKIPRLPDYRDATLKYQRGNAFYQFFAVYEYEHHDMDLRKLLVADKITLKLPPAFGQVENYQSVDVILDNESVPRNWYGGLVVGSTNGEVVPQGQATLNFVGVDAFTEAQAIDLLSWNQDDAADPDDEGGGDGGETPDFATDTFFIMGHEPGKPVDIDSGRLYKMKFTESGLITHETFYDFASNSLTICDIANSRKTSVSKSGKVCISGRRGGFLSAGVLEVHLLDYDLNYINSVTFTDYWSGTTRREHQHWWGEQEHLYVVEKGVQRVKVHKFDNLLNPIWISAWIDIDCNTSLSVSPDSVGMAFFEDRVILHAFGPNGDGNVLVSLSTSTGNLINRVDGISFSDQADIPVMNRFHNDYFFIGFAGSGVGDEGSLQIWDYYLNKIRDVDLASLGTADLVLNGAQAFNTWITFLDGTIGLVNQNKSKLTRFDPLKDTLVYHSKIGQITPMMNHISGGKILSGKKGTSQTDHQGLEYFNSDSGSQIFDIPQAYNASDLLSPYSTPAAVYEGWELDYFSQGGTIPPPPPLDQYAGSIEITSDAQANDPGKKPSAFTDILNAPLAASDDCGGSGTNKTYIRFKGTDYCYSQPAASPDVVGTAVANFINSSIPGVSSSTGLSPQGDIRLHVESDMPGEADNNEEIIFLIPTALEGDPIFSKYTIVLTGGIEPATIDSPVDILIGGSLFAKTANIQGGQLEASIAQKVFDACNAVNTDQLSFSLNGSSIDIESTVQKELTVDLNIRNTGFSFATTKIQKV